MTLRQRLSSGIGTGGGGGEFLDDPSDSDPLCEKTYFFPDLETPTSFDPWGKKPLVKGFEITAKLPPLDDRGGTGEPLAGGAETMADEAFTSLVPLLAAMAASISVRLRFSRRVLGLLGISPFSFFLSIVVDVVVAISL
jgi:hypothetical protein